MFNSYKKQLQLVEQGLARVSTNGVLDTFKYDKHVMFDYLWHTDSALLEVRGHTYDNRTGALVVAAARKSFNYKEAGWWENIPLDTAVIAYKKFNGFMACVSEHETELVVSTTGSTKSNYVGLAKSMLPELDAMQLKESNVTALYEIVHPDDLHIVEETPGAHLLGYRCKQSGAFIPYGESANVYTGTLKGLLAIAELNRGEGFMCYSMQDVERLKPCKIKTPYYVGKKILMRASKKAVELLYNNPDKFAERLPLIWKPYVSYILNNVSKADYLQATDIQRRILLEQFEQQFGFKE